ncbi:MAG: hypothetical protein K2Y32_14515 [Candidatus Obscuribacterales bacterium]|nr:hypothetical protein [Candidatus Obscuribacterales bacterium]
MFPFTLDTQSGFAIILKKEGGRLQLSVRRKIGTPPGSQVVLTADESQRLANALSSSLPESLSQSLVGSFPDSIRAHNSALQPAESPSSSEDLSDMEAFLASEFPDLKRKKRSKAQKADFTIVKTAALGLGCLLVLGAIFAMSDKSPTKVSSPKSQALPVDPKAKVEDFARLYVSSMLDFRRDTYRASQIKAMSMMGEEQLAKYIKETAFPLSEERIKRLPAEQDVRIETVELGEQDKDFYLVKVKGGLVEMSSGTSKSHPLALDLKISKEPLIVIEQIDRENQAK